MLFLMFLSEAIYGDISSEVLNITYDQLVGYFRGLCTLVSVWEKVGRGGFPHASS